MADQSLNSVKEPVPYVFNPNEHLMQVKSREGSKDYLPVQWRIVWFRSLCPQGTIDTEEVEVDLDREMEEEVYVWNSEKRRSEKVVKRAKGYARFKATVTDGKGGKATGTKSECAASFADYIEKAETGAIGRALAGLGYGTQFAPELNEEHRIVDSPVENGGRSNGKDPAQEQTQAPAPIPPAQEEATTEAADTLVIAPSVAALRTRCKLLGKDFNGLVRTVKKQVVPDDELSMADRQAMHKLVVGWEAYAEQAAKKTA